MSQLEIHKKIDKFFEAGVELADVEVGRKLKDYNLDSKNYFFAKADENWLGWLWANGFLNKIKEKAEDTTRYSFQMPELEYLTRVSEKKSAKVAEIINNTPISEEKFNPEVISRFLWIISDMPAEQIKTLTNKIKKDRWVYLTRNFNQSGYEFRKIIEKLVEAKEYDALLEIAEAMLKIRTREDIKERRNRYAIDDIFYLDYIREVKLFEVLANIDGAYAEKALKLTIGTLGKIIGQQKESKGGVFKYQDLFALYDADIFKVDFGNRGRTSLHEDFDNLVVVVKKLIEETFKNREKAKELFGIIEDLPENLLAWKLKLFALSQCPEIFKSKIKEALFRVFEVGERYFEIEGGAEYHQTLIRCFSALDETARRGYVKKVFEYFGAELGDKDKERWRKRDGGKILCFIKKYLEPQEKEEAKKIFGISPNEAECAPRPVSSGIRGGTVNPRPPEPISGFKVEEIIKKLETDWPPEKLREKYKGDDFLKPRGARGLGDELSADFKERPEEYLENISKFFNKDKIHPNYLYSVLRGFEEMLRNKIRFNDSQIEKMLELFNLLKAEKLDFKKEEDDGMWLANWITVYNVVADIMLLVLETREQGKQIQAKHRKQVLNIIKYLLSIKDSPSKEDEKPEYGEPFGVAINSVRGRAYQAFTVFVQNDGDKLSEDAKRIFQYVLNDESLPIRFVIGYYLATFYFRDKKFIVELFPKIFPKDDISKKHIYLATWEGYLVNNLYSELFNELEEYYEYAIGLEADYYTKRKYSKDLDKALAIHLALAFVYLGLKKTDDLFKLFWEKENMKRHKEFIAFIGKSCLTRDRAGDEWFKENNVSKKKLIDFWDWVIENKKDESEIFSAFGYWINPDKEILDDKIVIKRMAKALELSKGDIDWDYAFLKKLPAFAKVDSENTLLAIRNYLFDQDNNLKSDRFIHRGEVKESLDIIYKNGNDELKREVKNLINILIEKGSSAFWDLKGVLKE